MLLLKATPNQISTYWDMFRWSIMVAFPPTEVPSDKAMQEILMQLLAGKMQLWVGYRQNGASVQILGTMTTAIIKDPVTRTTGLLIFSIFGWADVVRPSEWKDGYEIILRFAEAMKCNRIYFYSTDEKLGQLAKRYGARMSVYGVFDLGLFQNETSQAKGG